MQIKYRQKMKKVLFMFFGYLGLFSFGQDGAYDSLKGLLKKNIQDTTRHSILAQLSEICSEEEIPLYTREAIVLYPALLKKYPGAKNVTENQAHVFNNIGFYFLYHGKTDSAFVNFSFSLELSRQLNDKKGVLESLNNLGHIYENLGNVPLAIEYYNEARKMAEQTGDKRGLGLLLNNIAFIYD